jgi:hypothetical protein
MDEVVQKRKGNLYNLVQVLLRIRLVLEREKKA